MSIFFTLVCKINVAGYASSECKIWDNASLFGNDIKKIPDISSREDCACLCKEEPGCSFFTWIKKEASLKSAGSCRLKTSDHDRRSSDTRVSGSVECCTGIVRLEQSMGPNAELSQYQK